MVFDERIVTHPNGYTKEDMASQIAFLEQDYASGEIDQEYFDNAHNAINNMWLDEEHWQDQGGGDKVFFDPAYEEVAEIVDSQSVEDIDYKNKSFLELEETLIADKTYENMQAFSKSDKHEVASKMCEQDRAKTQANLEQGFRQLSFDGFDNIDEAFDDFGLER